jgi:hypothetical protein
MSQDIADDLERHTGAQQTHRAGVAKGVGAFPALRGNSGGSQTSARYAVEDRTVFERTMRCLDAQEHLSMRAWGARLLQVRIPDQGDRGFRSNVTDDSD